MDQSNHNNLNLNQMKIKPNNKNNLLKKILKNQFKKMKNQ